MIAFFAVLPARDVAEATDEEADAAADADDDADAVVGGREVVREEATDVVEDDVVDSDDLVL